MQISSLTVVEDYLIVKCDNYYPNGIKILYDPN